jgi:hypothetical protein
MTSYEQTVIISKGGVNTFDRSVCPVAPVDADGKMALAVKTAGGIILWYENRVEKWVDGISFIWPNKPTMKDAVLAVTRGMFYQFNHDGSVNARFDGLYYYWPDSNVPDPTDGCIMKVHVCHDARGQYFFEEEKCACGSCLYCDERCLNDSYFCSSICETKARF